jgi:hypothetical protein
VLVVWVNSSISDATWEKRSLLPPAIVSAYSMDRECRLPPHISPPAAAPAATVTSLSLSRAAAETTTTTTTMAILPESKSELKRSLTNKGLPSLASMIDSMPSSSSSVDDSPAAAADKNSLVPTTSSTVLVTVAEPGAPNNNETNIHRYVYGIANPAIDHPPTRAQLAKASRHLQPGACVDEDVYQEVTRNYFEWRSSNPILVDIHGVSEIYIILRHDHLRLLHRTSVT